MQTGLIAIVVGGTSGIGYSCARELVAAGYHVYLWGRRQEVGLEAANRLNVPESNGRASYCRCDVRVADSVRDCAADFLHRHDLLHVLINAAGVLRSSFIGSLTEEILCDQIETVLTGTIRVTSSLALPLMRARGISVNIGSVAGRHPFPELAAYGAAKAGVAHFTRVAAQEFFSSGARVICVCPGVVRTNLMPEPRLRALEAMTPGRRLQDAEQISRFIMTLVHTPSSALTGSIIDMDDGLGLFPMAPVPSAPSGLDTVRETSIPAVVVSKQTSPAPTKPSVPMIAQSSDSDATFRKLAEVFEKTFGVSAALLRKETTPADIKGWDSVGNLALISEIERGFQLTLDINEIMQMVDVHTILQVLKERGK